MKKEKKKTGKKNNYLKIFLVVILAAVLLFLFWSAILVFISEPNWIFGSLNASCVKEGESIPWPSANKNNECCAGLAPIPPTFPTNNSKEHISSLPEGCGISVGTTNICSNCGNGKCESWENACNCPQDCGDCSRMYDQIDGDLQKANYCTTDSDCKTLPLGGPYIEFGCYHYINKNENSTAFYDRMIAYSVQCGNIVDMCAPVPQSKCVNGTCVAQ
jgi:hypothetical protein